MLRRAAAPRRSFVVAIAAIVLGAAPAFAAGNPMKLVGALAPWANGQYSNVAADAARKVAYLGSFDDQGVAVIDTTNAARPSLTDVLSTRITGPDDTSVAALPPGMGGAIEGMPNLPALPPGM